VDCYSLFVRFQFVDSYDNTHKGTVQWTVGLDPSPQVFLLQFVQAGSDSLQQILREIVSCDRAGRTRCATSRITLFGRDGCCPCGAMAGQ
jgi:hypothetical protein